MSLGRSPKSLALLTGGIEILALDAGKPERLQNTRLCRTNIGDEENSFIIDETKVKKEDMFIM